MNMKFFKQACGNPADGFLVGLSGGLDSVVLLHMVRKYFPQARLVAFHFNHGFRADSDSDMIFCEAFCALYKIPFVAIKENGYWATKVRKENMESWGRDRRYKWFVEVAQEHDLKTVLTAHHGNDQMESMVMSWLTGNQSFAAGIPECRELSAQILLRRPLLNQAKAELQEYAALENLSYCHDASNADLSFLRNRVRHVVIPFLEKQSTGTLLDQAQRWQEQLQQKHQALQWALCQVLDPLASELDLDRWNKCPAFLQQESLKMWLDQRCKKPIRWTAAKLESLADFVRLAGPNASYDFFPKCTLTKVYDRLIYQEARSKQQHSLAEIEVRIGETQIENHKLVLEEVAKPADLELKKDPYIVYLDRSQIDAKTLVLRRRKEGDSFYPLGLGGRKKVKDFLIDRKINQARRESLWVLSDKQKVLWLVGLSVDERARISDQTLKAYKISFI